jgi:hypothetical protein
MWEWSCNSSVLTFAPSRPTHVTHEERAPGTHRIGCWIHKWEQSLHFSTWHKGGKKQKEINELMPCMYVHVYIMTLCTDMQHKHSWYCVLQWQSQVDSATPVCTSYRHIQCSSKPMPLVTLNSTNISIEKLIIVGGCQRGEYNKLQHMWVRSIHQTPFCDINIDCNNIICGTPQVSMR